MALPAVLRGQFTQFLVSKKITYTQGWFNFMDNVRNPAAVVVEVKSEQELQTVVQAVKKLNADKTPDTKITMRATGGWVDKPVCACLFAPWRDIQANSYNEGYSFSQVVGGRTDTNTPGTDVIIRFAKKFHAMKVLGPFNNPILTNPQTPIHQLPSTLVEVSAGVQIAELADFLQKNKLSLPTVSMIAWVTAVGLAGTAGHGTGRDEPAFSGLIESFKVCDMDGVIREIDSKHPDFETLRGGHSGLLGVVVSIKLRAVQAFNLRETIDLFTDTTAMQGKLGDILKNNQYISIMGMPSYLAPELEPVAKWQIRKWNHTVEKPLLKTTAPYHPDIQSFTQELQIKTGSSVMEYLVDPALKQLLPAFMLLSAATVTGARGTAPNIDNENHITHPQVAFPKEMRDVSYLIPVKDAQAGEVLENILLNIDKLLNKAAKRSEYPITYAIYVRYLKGTNGGLSTSSTSSEDERILAIDMVTHPEAPGIANFEQKFLDFLHSINIKPRHHLGKNFPAGVTRYDQFLDSEEIGRTLAALVRWYSTVEAPQDGVARLAMSPFVTSYLQSVLSSSPKPILNDRHNVKKIADAPLREHTDLECAQFLGKLHAEITKSPATTPQGQVAKEAFLTACQLEMENRLAAISSAASVVS